MGATNADLVIGSVQSADAGSYNVMVANDLGTATSTSAILHVNNRPVAEASATTSLSRHNSTHVSIESFRLKAS